MKIIVTGTVGLDKIPYLRQVARLAEKAGQKLTIAHVGQRMYAEATDVAEGRILDLPISRLNSLRRSIFKDILAMTETAENIIVNTHATFRWKHGLFPAFDFDQLVHFDADLYVCLMDNVDALHCRLIKEHLMDHSLKDLLVWREEETLATELMMMGCTLHRTEMTNKKNGGKTKSAQLPMFYIMARGQECHTAEMMYRLIFKPTMPKAYLSFPMTHVGNMPAVQAEINEFRSALNDHFVIFDPGDLEEQQLYHDAVAASEKGQKVIEVNVLGQTIHFDIAEIIQAAGDMHGQIYARDFKLIDQSDMIISYIPQQVDGRPMLSSGVERELQHAHEAAKEVYVIWRAKAAASPFITETATKIFRDVKEAIDHFQQSRRITIDKDGR